MEVELIELKDEKYCEFFVILLGLQGNVSKLLFLIDKREEMVENNCDGS